MNETTTETTATLDAFRAVVESLATIEDPKVQLSVADALKALVAMLATKAN